MSSNILIKRTCEYCKKEFEAKTTKTRYCSRFCNKKDWRQSKKPTENTTVDREVLEKPSRITATISTDDFLTVKEAAVLLKVSLRTLYRLIKLKRIKHYNLSERKILIRRKDIENNFDLSVTNTENDIGQFTDLITSDNSYTLTEVQEKYKISRSALSQIILRNNIPRKKFGIYTLVKKEDIEKIFS